MSRGWGVAFAFCRLLAFQLMPRLKAIHVQKLYRPEAGQPDAYNAPTTGADEADRLGTDPPAVRPDDQIHDGTPPRHGGDGSDPAPVHPYQRATPYLQGICRTRQGNQDDLPLPIFSQRGAAPRDQ